MKKINTLEKKSLKKEKNQEIKKNKNLFDHLEAIRITKNPEYYNSLTEKEKKGFGHWIILSWLSMDINLIELVSFLWRDGYYDKIPSEQFYKLLIEVVPKTNQKLIWIKKSKKRNVKLLEKLSEWYSISLREADDYLNILMANDNGMKELAWILEGLGLTDKESENLLTGGSDYD